MDKLVKKYMPDNYLLASDTARRLYNDAARERPIIDYHCHLSPQAIHEDKPFNNIGEIWLSGDHYKWRLMRSYGIDEYYVTGGASWEEKFYKYAEVLSTAAGNPLYHWTHMELRMFFGIEEPLNPDTAPEIWRKTLDFIQKTQLSPKKLMLMSDVRYVATTDDPADSLEYHKLIKESGFEVTVAPTYRPDMVFTLREADYNKYIARLSASCGFEITDIQTLVKALEERLDYFCSLGCRFSDIGPATIPNVIGTEADADCVFKKAIGGNAITDEEYNIFAGYLYVKLAGMYKARNIAMQLHLASFRNLNTNIFNLLGKDCGIDCTGDPTPVADVARLLDAINTQYGMPKTVIYTLNPTMYYTLYTASNCFPNIICGSA
ncbi:MAG: glucuronate isomerase, partial [Oscillospiraceae bacterium]|nr:glucuronate isomerase [Oscillospiraceae bacterium]